MTYIAVSIAVANANETDDAIARAARAMQDGASLIEWRIDELIDNSAGDESLECVTELIQKSPLPCIITCRSKKEGGSFSGTSTQLIDFIKSIVHSGHIPKYFDIELEIFRKEKQQWLEIFNNMETECSLILSIHDFDKRPANLIQKIEEMTNEEECNVIKLAWQARSLRDNLEAFELLKEKKKPTIAICMGGFGQMSRILAPKFGSLITFAADQHGAETASGQITTEELRYQYQFESIDPDTNVYGIIGWPVTHSLSPMIHNAGFEQIGWNGVYIPLPIPGNTYEYEHFKATVGELIDNPHLSFRGASVTMPHKENLLRFVEERGGRVDDYSNLAGAANTLIAGSTGAIACRNTDAQAIVDALCEQMNISTDRLKDIRIAILGAGGVARAAVAGLAYHNTELTVFNRSSENAQTMIESLQNRASGLDVILNISSGSKKELIKGGFDVYINCTVVGMLDGPSPDQTPIQAICGEDISLDDSTTVFDTVYTPSQTPMIMEAESRGARVVLGIDMFITQAAMQFESWTGEHAPISVWQDTLKFHATAADKQLENPAD